jgi:hypothetical protein
MSFLSFIGGLGLFLCGVAIGILWCSEQLDEAADLLQQCMKHQQMMNETTDALRRLQEQTRK